ncbi:Uncharacterized protein DAT39_018157 [Clarias magur]|uniref:Uncharacterized protein n=1 Tax=Clarias magur TaxID=1594786 RepID=A0A8J4WT97_CLAMG|nr:Uncharacterized protein DAT39_018157 [Clarias magur]
MLASRVESFHLPSGKRVSRLHRDPAVPEILCDHRCQTGKGNQKPGGGNRTREILAVAQKEGQSLDIKVEVFIMASPPQDVLTLTVMKSVFWPMTPAVTVGKA